MSSYTLIYIVFGHFKVSVTSVLTSFVHVFTYVHSLIQYCHSDMPYVYIFFLFLKINLLFCLSSVHTNNSPNNNKKNVLHVQNRLF